MRKYSRKPGSHISAFDVGAYIIALLMALLILYPFYNALLVSIVPMTDYVREPLRLIPRRIVGDSFAFVFQYRAIWTGLATTIFIVLMGTLYNMTLTVMTAFALTKNWPGRNLLNILIIFTMYFGGGLIPYYLLVRNLGLMDNLFSMILPTGIEFTYMVIIMRHFENLPADLEEAAEIDGAGIFTRLFAIILPLSLPILSTYALYYGVNRWNEWYNGMLFIRTASKQPLQLVLRNLVQDSAIATTEAQSEGYIMAYDDGIKMACILLTMLPILLLYPFLQRYFLTDLTAGAVKG